MSHAFIYSSSMYLHDYVLIVSFTNKTIQLATYYQGIRSFDVLLIINCDVDDMKLILLSVKIAHDLNILFIIVYTFTFVLCRYMYIYVKQSNVQFFLFYSEQSIASARASVMIYDDVNKKWVPSGTSSGLSKVQIYQHTAHQTFRVVGRKLHDHEVR